MEKSNNQLLERVEELLNQSENKYMTIVNLAKYAKLTILKDSYTIKNSSSLKPLVNSIYSFEPNK